MAVLEQNVRTLIPSLLQSTASAYTTLGNSILALGQLQKVSELLETVICSLKAEHGKYDDLLKVLSALAAQYKKLDVETKSHIRTVKEQAQINSKIIDEAKKQLLKGNNIAKYFTEIEQTVKDSQVSSEELRSKYDVVIYKVKDCCAQAKAGYERNENKADLAEKGANVGLLGGMGVGGTFAAFQVATKALCVFGVPGAIAGGALGLIGGCMIGGMAGGLPFATAEALFRKYAEKFKILDETLSQIDQILLENFEVLTEICRLLGKLKEATLNCPSIDGMKPGMRPQDTNEPKHNHSCDEAVSSGEAYAVNSCDDNTNIDFLIRLKFDTFKQASQELEKNCDYLLDDMPLKTLGLLSLEEKEAEKKKLK
ncbi:uncharacterized protein LOC114533620 isoform X1 [Dendronephthya gigantea]|uniref:uncharacterized protein LOC114533620 isoform X1 n=1 Tax=Dendronephthya gigantea TaxID=151771 RepID=UPI00106973B8|nr:uncharacterized protein LOC114533620 isoform X1 [Dendronephthya gigantea]XP_028410987.1 uncharacterized protein LOC114533620 isoform X1 [Dendronephthya gigantea]XP_028410988.1 uncharacterized protein LOC114533620 isoform X1 [Dendronephthya gigantea]